MREWLSELRSVKGGWQPERGRQHGLGRHFQLLDLGLVQALGFRAPILEPDLHLRLSQIQRRRELGALRYGEVLFLAELALEGEQLRGGEGRARFAVRFVLA